MTANHKPSPLHLLAVSVGVTVLFASIWVLVKENAAHKAASSSVPAATARSAAAPSAPVVAPAPAVPEAETPSSPRTATATPPAPTPAEPPAPPAAAPSPSAPAPAPTQSPEEKQPDAAKMADTENMEAAPETAEAKTEAVPSPAMVKPEEAPAIPPPSPQPPAEKQAPSEVAFVVADPSPPKAEDKPAVTKDAPAAPSPKIKDVTGSLSNSHDMEGEPEEGPAHAPILPETTRNIKPSTSTDLPGWELLRFQTRDYVTANSIQRFYRFASLSIEGKNVWFRSPVLVMKATVGSSDLLINNIKFVMSYPVVELNDKPSFSRLDLCKLIDPVLRPSYIGTAKPFDTVVIDPGHGGSDGGARGIYGHEKDFALKLAFKLKSVLEQKGLKVIMTRSTDVFISLGGRVAIANKTPNCIYVSLHFNSGQSSATGIETFALSPQGSSSIYGAREVDSLAFQGNQLDSENIALATAVHAGVVHHFKLVDRGVKRARWHVLKGLTRPGILFEGGFVTNPNDGRLIAADNFQTELASTIGQSIMNYRRALQPRAKPR